MKKTEPEYYPPVENLLDLIYEHYTEKNPVEKNTVAGKAAKAKEKELEEWLRGLDGMDRLVDDYIGDKIPLWEKIMDRQGTVCRAWEKTAFEEGLKVGMLVVVPQGRQTLAVCISRSTVTMPATMTNWHRLWQIRSME